jgi:hypothetical protein
MKSEYFVRPAADAREIRVTAVAGNRVQFEVWPTCIVTLTRSEARAVALQLEEAAMECETEQWSPPLAEAHGVRRGGRR